MSHARRYVVIVAGMVSVGIGAVGVVVPLLPTTPFLLPAAWCFARSSERLHRWLVGHPRLGQYVAGFLYAGGMSRKAKATALAVLWAGIVASAVIVLWQLEAQLRKTVAVAGLAGRRKESVRWIASSSSGAPPRRR